MMTIIPNVVYNPAYSERGLGDLCLPENPSPRTPIAISIHGGGWSAMDKSSFAGVANFLCTMGFATFNTHYRLCGTAPWPACADDCLEAAQFVLNAGHDTLKNLDRRRITIIGASAGGHLALITGLRLPPECVAAIVSISGVADPTPDAAAHPERYRGLLGHEYHQDELLAVSPIPLLRPDSPRMLLTHTPHDSVVPIASATNFIAAAQKLGLTVDSYFYERANDGHCIWLPDSNPHQLYPDIENAIATFIQK